MSTGRLKPSVAASPEGAQVDELDFDPPCGGVRINKAAAAEFRAPRPIWRDPPNRALNSTRAFVGVQCATSIAQILLDCLKDLDGRAGP